jgi:hypothetical protein
VPRFAIMLAAILILAAGLYGGVRGFAFTDLDQAPPPLPATAVVAPPVAPVAAQPAFDEMAVREMARAEARAIIRPRPRPSVQARPPAAETPSAESLPAENGPDQDAVVDG